MSYLTFRHIRTEKNGCVTVAVIVSGKEAGKLDKGETPNTFTIGLGLMSPADNFWRKEGRKNAAERLGTFPLLIEVGPGKTISDAVVDKIEEIVRTKDRTHAIPFRARKWLKAFLPMAREELAKRATTFALKKQAEKKRKPAKKGKKTTRGKAKTFITHSATFTWKPTVASNNSKKVTRCKQKGCAELSKIAGYCGLHYHRNYRAKREAGTACSLQIKKHAVKKQVTKSKYQCKVKDCGKAVHARGLCASHYMLSYRAKKRRG